VVPAGVSLKLEAWKLEQRNVRQNNNGKILDHPLTSGVGLLTSQPTIHSISLSELYKTGQITH
jgi:hypothetical protein